MDTTENVADAFTKCLSGTELDNLRDVVRREAMRVAHGDAEG